MADEEAFDSFAVVELMGHVKMAGRLTEEERFGSKLGRLDIPGEGDTWSTVYFNGASVYRITPCSEEVARHVAKRNRPEPVHQWELPKQIEAAPKASYSGFNPDDKDDEDSPDDSRDMEF